MKRASPDAKARGVYAALLVLSLPLPVFHHQVLGGALWAVRYPWGLHPIQNLSVWHLGRLSAAVPVLLVTLLVASWRWRKLCEPATFVRVALAFCAFTVLYAVECGFALMMALDQH